MLNYIYAELNRVKKSKSIIVFSLLSLFAIGLTYFIYLYNENPSADGFLNGIGNMVKAFIIFIACIIYSGVFKKSSETKNYIQRGYSRLNLVIGDIIVIMIFAIIFSILLSLISIGVSYLFPQPRDSTYIIDFVRTVVFANFILLLIVISSEMIYILTNSSGITVAFTFLAYLLLYQICFVFQHSEIELLANIAKFIVKVSPMKFMNSAPLPLMEIIKLDGFVSMVIIHLVFLVGSILFIKRKNI